MESNSWKQLWQIFWVFLKIGPVTFGGGYAVIPVIEREMVEHNKWVSKAEIADVLALAGTLPGAIAINAATFIGYKLAGVKGAIVALLGIFLPTFLIVIALSTIFLQVRDQPKVEAAFKAIRVTIVALIAYAGYSIGKTAVFDKTTLITAVSAFGLLLFLHIHPVLIILLGIMFGILLVKLKDHYGYETKLEKDEKQEEKWEWFMGEGI